MSFTVRRPSINALKPGTYTEDKAPSPFDLPRSVDPRRAVNLETLGKLTMRIRGLQLEAGVRHPAQQFGQMDGNMRERRANTVALAGGILWLAGYLSPNVPDHDGNPITTTIALRRAEGAAALLDPLLVDGKVPAPVRQGYQGPERYDPSEPLELQVARRVDELIFDRHTIARAVAADALLAVTMRYGAATNATIAQTETIAA